MASMHSPSGNCDPLAIAINSHAKRISKENGESLPNDINDATATVLLEIISIMLAEAGPGHFPHPSLMKKERAEMGVVLLLGCQNAVTIALENIKINLDGAYVFDRVFSGIYGAYLDEERMKIKMHGVKLYGYILSASQKNNNNITWHNKIVKFTLSYILSSDTSYLGQLAQVYTSLCLAAKC